VAPLSPDNTPRFKVSYTNMSRQHTAEFRSHESPSALGTHVDSLFTALMPLVATTVIDVVEYAPSGSNIFNPVTTGIEGNTYTGATAPAESKAWFVSFIGRTTGGRRCRLYIFGSSLLATDYRWLAGENAAVDDAIAVLQAWSPALVAIDDLGVIWKSYANAGANAYLQKKIRP